MKHSQISILMLSVLATVSGLFSACSSDEDEALLQPSSKTVTVTAGIDTDATRIALGESDGSSTKVLWSPNEQIALVAGDASYTFTRSDEGTDNVASADFSYTGELPAFTSEAYFCYPATQPTSWATQPGTAEGLAQYMTLRADLPEGTDSYDGLNLHFIHETAVVKATLTHEIFKGKSVHFYLSGAGITTTSDALVGDAETGTVTAYFVVLEGGYELKIKAECGGVFYSVDLGYKDVYAGKLYKVSREHSQLTKEEYNSIMINDGQFVNSVLKTNLGSCTKIAFVTQSNTISEKILLTDANGISAYLVTNGDCLEIHTPVKEFEMIDGGCGSLFYDLSTITAIDFGTSFNTAGSTWMASMFHGCFSLASLDVSGFNTANVTTMDCMFAYCSSLTNLNLSNFNTDKVEYMGGMFRECTFSSLDLSNFNTANVKSMGSMFSGSTIVSLDLSNFNTEKVEDMGHMFRNCSSLKSLDISSFDTKSVTTMQMMFYECSSLASLDVSKFNTEKVADMYYMFYNCSSVKELDVSNFNTENVTNMYSMFSGCSSITSLDVSNFNTANVTNMGGMFCAIPLITSLNLSNFNTEKVTRMEGMFYGCSALVSLDISSFSFEAVTRYTRMFHDISADVSEDLSVTVNSAGKEWLLAKNLLLEKNMIVKE